MLKLGIDYKNRILGLDILRAMAILTVVYNHGWIYSQKFMPKVVYDRFHFDGVTLFFVLSGFLIGGIIFKTIETKGTNYNSLKDFWIRRWFRTLPLYYLILIFLVIKACIACQTASEFFQFSRYFIFLQNFFSYKPTYFNESWSLAVEEWFYIILPIMLWVLVGIFKFDLKRTTPYFILFFIVLCFSVRFMKFELYEGIISSGKPIPESFPFTVMARLDSLIFGVLCAYVFRYFESFWIKYKNWLLVLGISALIFDYILNSTGLFFEKEDLLNLRFYQFVLHYTIMPFAIALIIPFFYYLKSDRRLSRIFIFISIISYSLYLIHLSVIANLKLPQTVAGYLPFSDSNQAIFAYMFYWLFSIFFASLLYRFYEKPMTNLREYVTKDS